MFRILTLAIGVAGCASASPQPVDLTPNSDCRLVIVGGALDIDNKEVWGAFLDGAKETGDIAIVPTASGFPAGSGVAARDAMIRHGWPEDRIRILPLAVVDDPDTEGVDEADWASNADDPDIVAALETAAGIWWTGGDQARIARLFGTPSTPRPGLLASQSACASGAVLGGTSAGAAIMSDPMIVRGDSLPALIGETDADSGALRIEGGLGFFKSGIIDQHFGERAREGRLLSTLGTLADSADRIGFGVDEDTSLVVEPDGTAYVAGAGQITVIDARRAALSRTEDGYLGASAVTLHLLSRGDEMDLATGALRPASWRDATIGNEYFDRPSVAGSGIAVPQPKYAGLLGDGLLDNSAATELTRFTFAPTGQGFAFTFTQVPGSRGYWGRDEDGRAAYTLANIRLDIAPASLSVEPAE